MKHRLSFLLVAFSFVALSVRSELLPLPQQINRSDEVFLCEEVAFRLPEEVKGMVTEWADEWQVKEKTNASRHFEVHWVTDIPEALRNKDEAYTLHISREHIHIDAIKPQGVYRAMQTLRQLTERSEQGVRVRGCRITDWPAFRIRGWMHDVGRSYISLEELKREIVLLSRYKINTFHWHLTENQAWRLESKRYPALNDSAHTTRMPGKYYTHEEARELVDFCRKHFVTLIPEIDIPGHSAAFERAFGCGMQSEKGMNILKTLIDEACEVFDVPYLHIGTDEVEFTNPLFVPEMVAFVRARGKKVVSWNPGWTYQPGEIDMTQLWSYRGKAQQGIPAIDSRFHYLNHFDTFGDIVALYNSRIYNEEQGSENLAGVILGIWNDRLLPDERSIILQNGLYPNMLAIAERAWRGGGFEYFDRNGVILPDEHSEPFRAFADFERRMLWHKAHYFKGYPFPYVRQTHVKWTVTDAFPNGGDLSKRFPPEEQIQTTYEYEGKTYGTRTVTGSGIYLRHVWGDWVPALYEHPQENHTAYAYTWVYAPQEQEAGMRIEFQNYSRSEPDLPPRQGTWDDRQSSIHLNGKEIMPPVWTATHTEKSNETALGNENSVARPPIRVRLRKGWNHVFLKLPVGRFTTPEVRLVKWMFTVAFVTLDGEQALEGLIFSPEPK